MAYIEHEVRVSGDHPADRITRIVEERPRRMWYRSLAALSPDHLPGLQLHLDAQALALGDGAAVASWPDLSPNAVPFTQSDPTQQPSVVADGINGKKSVRFGATAGAGQTLTAPVGPGTKPASSRYDQFVVLSNGSRADYVAAGFAEGTAEAVVFGYAGANNGYAFEATNFGLQVAAAWVNDAPTPPNLLAAPLAWLYGTPTVCEASYDGGTLRGFQDGGLTASDSASPFTFPASGSIALSDLSFPFVGDIGEVIMFDRVLSEQERLGVTAYLLDRWQLAV